MLRLIAASKDNFVSLMGTATIGDFPIGAQAKFGLGPKHTLKFDSSQYQMSSSPRSSANKYGIISLTKVTLLILVEIH